MLTPEMIIEFLKANRQVLRDKFYCEEIGLFGSFARNEQNETSDIDIIVQFEKDTPDLYSVENELKSFIKSHFGREVDICSKKWIKPVFKPLVMKEAIYA
jgi:predicted nucleotidyltransferase